MLGRSAEVRWLTAPRLHPYVSSLQPCCSWLDVPPIQVLWLMEPDFYQYHEEKQAGPAG